MSLRAGERLGPYEIQHALGAGGMGEVYLASDTRLDRLVAIKVLPHQTAHDPDLRERFVREARLASRLTHPNLCTLFDVGSQADADFFVMEYVEGETLAARLARGPLALDEVVRYAIHIADGLAKAHASGVIHRDLKPANVMITPDGIAKILDFGLAKQVGIDERAPTALASVTAAGIVMGTVAYMSPEQTQGHRADARSDIFSFGVTLYEMLTGQRPFDGPDLISTLRRINDNQPAPVRARRPELSPAFESIVATALEKHPDRRFQSAAELCSRLREAAAELPAPRSGADRRRTIRRAGIAIAAGSLAGVAFLVVPRWLGRTAPSHVESEATPTTAIAWVRQGENLLQRHDRSENVDKAVAAFSSALALDPKLAVAHAGLAMAYVQKLSRTPDPQFARLATESARQALAANPDLAVSHLAQGAIFLRTGKTDDALKELLLARDADPLNAKVERWLGEYFTAVNESTQAEAAFKRAIELQPDDWASNGAFGSFLYRYARYEEALAVWERAEQLAPDNVVILRNLAAAYHQLERTDEGIAKLQRALEAALGGGYAHKEIENEPELIKMRSDPRFHRLTAASER